MTDITTWYEISAATENLSGWNLTTAQIHAITGNDRWNKGNTTDRRNRRSNLLRHWGDGTVCLCVWCDSHLRDRGVAASGAGLPDHITVDHIVCHTDGGTYKIQNLVLQDIIQI